MIPKIRGANLLDFFAWGLNATGNYDNTLAIFSLKYSKQKNITPLTNGDNVTGASTSLSDISVGWRGGSTGSAYIYRTTEGFPTMESNNNSNIFAATNAGALLLTLDKNSSQICFAFCGKISVNASNTMVLCDISRSSSHRFYVTIPINSESIYIECSNDDSGTTYHTQTTDLTGKLFGKYVPIVVYVDYVNNEIKLLVNGVLENSTTPTIGGAIPNTNSDGINFTQYINAHIKFFGFVKNKVFTTNDLKKISNLVSIA